MGGTESAKASRIKLFAHLSPEKRQSGPLESPAERRGGWKDGLRGLATEDSAAGIFRLAAQLLLDADELVVFGEPVGTGEAAGLDLPAICGDGEVGDRRILGL